MCACVSCDLSLSFCVSNWKSATKGGLDLKVLDNVKGDDEGDGDEVVVQNHKSEERQPGAQRCFGRESVTAQR